VCGFNAKTPLLPPFAQQPSVQKPLNIRRVRPRQCNSAAIGRQAYCQSYQSPNDHLEFSPKAAGTRRKKGAAGYQKKRDVSFFTISQFYVRANFLAHQNHPAGRQHFLHTPTTTTTTWHPPFPAGAPVHPKAPIRTKTCPKNPQKHHNAPPR